jgi:hypothetical protein
MKVDVAYIDSGSQWHTERLNSSIEVHVVEGILIVPDALAWIGHFVSHEPDAIICGIGLVTGHGRACACPSCDRRLLLHGRAVR